MNKQGEWKLFIPFEDIFYKVSDGNEYIIDKSHDVFPKVDLDIDLWDMACNLHRRIGAGTDEGSSATAATTHDDAEPTTSFGSHPPEENDDNGASNVTTNTSASVDGASNTVAATRDNTTSSGTSANDVAPARTSATHSMAAVEADVSDGNGNGIMTRSRKRKVDAEKKNSKRPRNNPSRWALGSIFFRSTNRQMSCVYD